MIVYLDKLQTKYIHDKGRMFDDNTSKNIIPIFYQYETNIDGSVKYHGANSWVDDTTSFLKKYKEAINKTNYIPLVVDVFEASKNFKSNVSKLSEHLETTLYVTNSDRKLYELDAVNIKPLYCNFWANQFPARNKILHYIPSKLYINLTRVARPHRCELINELIKNNLFEEGYNTFGDAFNDAQYYKNTNPKHLLDTVTFDTLDVKDFKNVNPNNFAPLEQCITSFLYLCTETLVDNERMFFSEKVYKPLGLGMPFITLGNPGTLNELRKLGFKTFDKWFDESYDNDIPIEKRIKIIINNLKDLKNRDTVSIRQEMTSTLKHNLRTYKKLQKYNHFQEMLKELK